jgi:hypothetical protein
MQLLFLLAGACISLLAIFAVPLGLDHNPQWGTGRAILLLIGLAFLGFSALNRQKRSNLRGACRSALQRVPWKVVTLALSMLVVVCFAAYALWYTSNGRFPFFDRIGNYYVTLGDAFAHGQLSLRELPDPRLIQLQDPYTMSQRKDIPYLWDASYFQGKYYLYWGPVPALLYAAIQAVTGVPPIDQLGILLAAIGLQVLTLLLLWRWRQRFFPRAPGFSIPLFVLVAGFNVPYLHLLGRPEIYETSILAGQFFLFLGVLAWQYADETGKRLYWALTGLAWGLSIASRYNLAVSVMLLVAFALGRVIMRHNPKAVPWKTALALLAPMGLVGLTLAWYNFARFGNFFETGIHYQLTVQVFQDRYFSPAYLPSNLYAYLAYPFHLTQTIPFFHTPLFQKALLPAWAPVPPGKLFDEVLVGTMYSSPVLLLILLAIPLGWRGFVLWRARQNPHPPRWIYLAASFALVGLAQFAFLLVYYYTAMRFQADYYLPFLLATCFCVWATDERIREWPLWRTLFWIAVILLALSSAVIAFFAGFDVPPQSFRLHNPDLYQAVLDSIRDAYTQVAQKVELVRSFLRLLTRGA